MNSRELGLVIKRFFPAKNKVGILSRSSGRINAVVKSDYHLQRLCPGHFISYQPVKLSTSGTTQVIESVEIVLLPFDGMTGHLIWLHHLLEVCYYFVPLQSPCVELFDHIVIACDALAHSELQPYSAQLKRIVMVRLFALLGMNLDKQLISMAALFNHIHQLSIDSHKSAALDSFKAACQSLTSTQLQCADAWALACIKTHPNVSSFKTLSFLK